MAIVRSFRRASALAAALALGVGAIGVTASTAVAASDSGSGITVTSFTSDFSAMAQLKDLAAKGKGKVVALLPDTQSSARYVQYDEPFLKQAFAAAGLSSDQYQVQNAQGSAQTMQTQAEAAITNGASVLLIDPLDSGSGAAIEAEREVQGRRDDRLRPAHAQWRRELLRELRQRQGRQGHRSRACRLRDARGR